MIVYYLFGLAPAIFFASRFILQWIISEKNKASLVTPIFWKLSLIGNCLLGVHYLLQLQLPFLIIQTLNACIAWRNLKIIKKQKKPLLHTLKRFSLALLFVLSACLILKVNFAKDSPWLTSPAWFKHQRVSVSFVLHLLGIVGAVLFASRFWIQWWVSEKEGKSVLPSAFWILSILGSALSLFYFIQIHDLVSILYGLFGLIPYLRNLILIKKYQQAHLQQDNLTRPDV